MDTALVTVRLLLSLVFFVAGIAKLTDRAGTRKAIMAFGVAPSLAVPLSVALPIGEVLTATALLFAASAWWGAAGALLLLLLFSGAIGWNLLQGKRPDCHCFGQLHSAPIGWPVLARNGVFAAAALFLLLQGQARLAASGLSSLTSAALPSGVGLLLNVVVPALLLLEGWFLLHLMRQNGRLFLRIDQLEARMESLSPHLPTYAGLALGSLAPDFDLPDLAGETWTVNRLTGSSKAMMLIFTDPQCHSCSELLPQIVDWQQRHKEILSFVLISRGSVKDNRAKLTGHAVERVLLQNDREVAQAYLAEATPSAVLVLPNGTIGSPLSVGKNAIEALIAQIEQPSAPEGLAFGSEAPDFTLPTLAGETRSLSEFRGRSLVLIFFNPRCGYCLRMAPDLAAIPTNGEAGYALPLVVTTGGVEDNERVIQKHHLRGVVLLQQGEEIAARYRAHGTPMGYLIDEEGRIASPLLSGADALLNVASPAVSVVSSEMRVEDAPSIEEKNGRPAASR